MGRRPRPRAANERLLALLGEHQLLTTGQLVRLTGMPERTVQHRLGVLYRRGLVSRHRRRAAVGTSPSNAAVFERLEAKDGRLCHEQYRPPFDDIFSVPEFEYET